MFNQVELHPRRWSDFEVQPRLGSEWDWDILNTSVGSFLPPGVQGSGVAEVSFRLLAFDSALAGTGIAGQVNDTHAEAQLADSPEEANHVRTLQHVACMAVPSHA